MALHFPTLHAASDTDTRFECTGCGTRLTDTDGGRRCPSCGAAVRNISVSRN
ncbi:MAG: hypothetical protein J07HN4v3_00468 [Halonotius sp. J07HN4]|nr:MAG: hypothetical protein J07HN4v3_00468 [Halonotius sp. J07HN4]